MSESIKFLRKVMLTDSNGLAMRIIGVGNDKHGNLEIYTGNSHMKEHGLAMVHVIRSSECLLDEVPQPSEAKNE
jgi:hypothetical protein